MAYAALAATSALWSGNTITGRALADALPAVAFSFANGLAPGRSRGAG